MLPSTAYSLIRFLELRRPSARPSGAEDLQVEQSPSKSYIFRSRTSFPSHPVPESRASAQLGSKEEKEGGDAKRPRDLETIRVYQKNWQGWSRRRLSDKKYRKKHFHRVKTLQSQNNHESTLQNGHDGGSSTQTPIHLQQQTHNQA